MRTLLVLVLLVLVLVLFLHKSFLAVCPFPPHWGICEMVVTPVLEVHVSCFYACCVRSVTSSFLRTDVCSLMASAFVATAAISNVKSPSELKN